MASMNIRVSDTSVENVDIEKITLREVEGQLLADIVGNVKISGTIYADTDYYETRDMDDISMTVSRITVDLSDKEYYDFLDKDSAEFYDEFFETDYEELEWNDWEGRAEIVRTFVDMVNEDEIDIDDIANELRYVNFDCKTSIFGGWSYPTLDGDIDIDTDDFEHSSDLDIVSCTITITNENAVDYINRATRGDNVSYRVEFNGDLVNYYDDEDDAIEELKLRIEEYVQTEDGLEDIDLTFCFVTSEFSYWGDDIDEYPQSVYEASEDPEFDWITEWQEEHL